MARRRMFSLDVIDTDSFLDLPSSSQALYFQLGCRTDDDGFIGNPKRLLRILGFSEDDLKILCIKNFVIPFESGVIVITHFKSQNSIRNDRYSPTIYKQEKSMLSEGDDKSYSLRTPYKNGVQ